MSNNIDIFALKLKISLKLEKLLQLNNLNVHNNYLYQPLINLLKMCYTNHIIIIEWLKYIDKQLIYINTNYNHNNNQIQTQKNINQLINIDDNILLKTFEYLNIIDIINFGYTNKYNQILSRNINISNNRFYDEIINYLLYYQSIASNNPNQCHFFRFPYIEYIDIRYNMIKCIPFLCKLQKLSFNENIEDSKYIINESLKLLKKQYYLKEFRIYNIYLYSVPNYLCFLSRKCNYKLLQKVSLLRFELSKFTIQLFEYFINIRELILDVESIRDNNIKQLILLFKEKLLNLKYLNRLIIMNLLFNIDLMLLFFTQLKIKEIILSPSCIVNAIRVIDDFNINNIILFENVQIIKFEMIWIHYFNYKKFFHLLINNHFEQITCYYDFSLLNFSIFLTLLSKIKNNGYLILHFNNTKHLKKSYENYYNDHNSEDWYFIIHKINKPNIQIDEYYEWKKYLNIDINNIGNFIISQFDDMKFLLIYCDHIHFKYQANVDTEFDNNAITILNQYICNNMNNKFSQYHLKLTSINNDLLCNFSCKK